MLVTSTRPTTVPSTVTAIRGAPPHCTPRTRTTILSVAAESVTAFDADVGRESSSALPPAAAASVTTLARDELAGLNYSTS